MPISAPIVSNAISFSGQSNGLRIDFAPSAVKPFYNGGAVVLSGNNSFSGDVTLVNGDLTLAYNNALGVATDKLVVEAGNHSLRFDFDPVAGTNPTINNSFVLNSGLTITGYIGANPTLNGSWSGSGGLFVNNPQSLTMSVQGAMNFTGPLVMQSMNVGTPQRANQSAIEHDRPARHPGYDRHRAANELATQHRQHECEHPATEPRRESDDDAGGVHDEFQRSRQCCGVAEQPDECVVWARSR